MGLTCKGEAMPSRNNELPLADEIRQTEEQLLIDDGLALAIGEPHASTAERSMTADGN
jgi:hypothetical protein